MRQRLRSRLAEQERLAATTATENDALAGQLALLREVVDTIPSGVVVVDRAGKVVLANRCAAAPTGDLHADALVSNAVEALLEAARSSRGEPVHDVVDMLGPPRRTVEITAQPITSTGGVVAVIEDVSERRRVDILRRDFVDNVNHELRTPIGALGVLLDALEGETNAALTARLIARMRREVDRAHALIEDWLELSSVERHTESARVDIDLVDIVAAAVSRVEAVAEQADVRVSVDGPASVALSGDGPELTSALANLLDNAIKYSPAGSAVSVTVRHDDEHVDVEVSDHGIGIPAKDLDRIFERFYRVDRARDRRTGGTGLGLSIVRHVALNHGGDVLVSSTEGEGSTFTLRLAKKS